MKQLVAILVLLLPLTLIAQLDIPPASTAASSSQEAGFTKFEVEYHRPNLRGRKIFGELIPFGKIWRSGANEATVVRVNGPFKIGETEISAGSYSLYSIPGEKKWTMILNKATDLWGARGYDESNDVVRIEVRPTSLPSSTESLEFRWMNVRPQSLDLVLEWENTRVALPIQIPTDEQVAANIKEQLGPNSSGSDYYRAARYYLDNDLDLKQAQAWMDKRVELDGDQFGILRYKAIIEKKLGLDQQAKETMELSLKLAKEKGNQHYVRMNSQSLLDWRRQAVEISGKDLLSKSIKYHDPKNFWRTAEHIDFQLYEERPNGAYRISNISTTPKNNNFGLTQRRGRNMLTREVNNEECFYRLNGKSDISEEDKKTHRFNCEYTTRIRDYYNYLWGLPMKLEDAGTIIDEQVHLRHFFGEDLLELKVTYDPEVGGDIWYFYFDPNNYALKGYRFYHDESKNDGEYILLSGEERLYDMRLPAKREWYTHKDRRYLGFDLLLEQLSVREKNSFE